MFWFIGAIYRKIPRSLTSPANMFCPHCGAQQVSAANFCSACGARIAVPQPPVEASSVPQPVKVLDAAGKLLLSGSRAEDVQKTLEDYLRKGAKLITPLCQVGKSWTAVCTMPPRADGPDDTQTLYLAEIAAAVQTSAGDEEPDDGCRVERLGFKRIIYGPSARAVRIRIDFLKQFGAELVADAEEIDGEWTAVCDLGDAKNTGYRW
jgi:hypothetical protein